MEVKKRKKRSVVAIVGDKEFVAFSRLHLMLGKDISAKTFKGILEGSGIQPAYKSGSTQWYDLEHAKQVFTQPHSKMIHQNTDS